MAKVLVTTLPKSGTHYLNVVMQAYGFERHFCDVHDLTAGMADPDPERAKKAAWGLVEAIERMPDGHFMNEHVPHSSSLMFWLEKRHVKVVALLRNPYDFVVSLAHHLRREPSPDAPADLSLHALQHWICSHIPEGHSDPMAKRYFTRIGGWAGDPRAFLLRFEDIIGPRGGGSFADQLATGLKLRDYLGVALDEAGVARALISSYNPDISMFRRGRIGGWRDEMAPNTATHLALLYGRFLDAWGYTPDGELQHHAGDRPDILADIERAVAGLIEDNVHFRAKAMRIAKERATPAAAPTPPLVR